MLVKDIMTGRPSVVSPGTPVVEAARLMRDGDTGFLPVCEGERLVGTVTDRDLTIRIAAEGRRPDEASVAEAMSADPLSVFLDEPLADAARAMSESQLRRLPVLDREGRLVGILSLGDLATRAGDDALVGAVMEGVSEAAGGPLDLRAGGF
ncbi:MAG TPA: CBS domain-containing protein [Alphaproteobacteria bacterium]|nr:CBS domain-containing protein [Alphaproteobacteria bacterium]